MQPLQILQLTQTLHLLVTRRLAQWQHSQVSLLQLGLAMPLPLLAALQTMSHPHVMMR